MPHETTHNAIEAVWRIESGRLLGALLRMVRDVQRAEDLAQEALLAALQSWPDSGIPDNPGAWLMATAKHRAIDTLRRDKRVAVKHEALGATAISLHDATTAPLDELERALDEDVGDDVLRLMLVACHPVLSAEARVALTLRLLGGLSTEAIARAFLVPEPTIAQRIVRGKRTLAEARVPFEVPRGAELSERLPSVFEAVYLIFNEGYAATSGEQWMRAELVQDALRLGRVLAQLVPDEAEAHGLVALMELHASRMRARLGPKGEPVLLLDQDRGRWDRLLIGRGLAALSRAEALAAPLGVYTLQAAIAACHARAGSAVETDWSQIVALYDALVELTGSPVVALNRAVAVWKAFGAEDALALLDGLADEPALRGYAHYYGARAEMLWSLGRREAACRELARASEHTHNAAERALLDLRMRAWSAERDSN